MHRRIPLKEFRMQSALEYLTTYGWALLIVAIVAVALFLLAKPTQTQECALPGDFGCVNYAFMANGTLNLTIIQNTHAPIYITAAGCATQKSTQDMQRVSAASQGLYIPVGVPESFEIECYSKGAPYITSLGSYFNGYVSLNYTDTATSLPNTVFGGITVEATQTGISTTFAPTAAPTAPPSVITTPSCYPLSLSGSGTQTASPTSSGGCPSGEYTVGTSVSITATPPTGYTFASWSGTGTGSYTGSSNPGSVTMDSAVAETANYQSAVVLEQALSFATQSATISTTEPDSVILIAVNGWSSGSPTVTVDGNSATELYSSHTGNTGQAVMFYYVAPSAGSHAISISLGGLSSTYDQNYAVSVGGVTTSGIGVTNLSGDYNPASLSISVAQDSFLFETNEYQCTGSGSTAWSTSSGTITSIGDDAIENCIASSAAYEIAQSPGSYTITVSMPNYNAAGGDQILASLPAG